MSDASARGRSARRSGHDAERKVAAWLRDHGYPDACTTRSRLGSDGTKQPGDVIGPVGIVIEVKSRVGSSWPAWCRQAERDAGGRAWIVVRRTPGVTDVGEWPAMVDDGVQPVPLGNSVPWPFAEAINFLTSDENDAV
jgi:hypothetical protein